MFHGAYTPALVRTLSGAIISVLAKFPMGVARLGPPPDQVSSGTCKEKPMTTTEALPSAKDETGSLLAALGVSRDLVAGRSP
jgi:hypothetical protein